MSFVFRLSDGESEDSESEAPAGRSVPYPDCTDNLRSKEIRGVSYGLGSDVCGLFLK